MFALFADSPKLQKYIDQIDQNLLVEALTHKSWAFENGGMSYDRLEFMGDAILGTIVSRWLYFKFPDQNEGFLTEMRQKYISTEYLSGISNHYQLKKHLLLGVGMKTHDEQVSLKMSADVVESVIAAHFLSTSFDKTSEFVSKFLN
jgi:ribonuclease-3